MIEWLRKVLGVQSPSRVHYKEMCDFGKGFAEGVSAASQVAKSYWIEDGPGYKCAKCETHFRDELLFIKEVDGELPKHCPECGKKMIAACRGCIRIKI